ncbi:MAG TPA: CDP-alcohol phosphatidyltransferase family protein [Ornithinimicrobium sp.]|uniref:CDP-alcohol phosphatidyltransferase family protein n=1 Tax=Ornithinimicrobium sp. TaxID=1977084 RepID=UPI002B468DD6|nr:CDP-alcohol phosphatidyltransferase family protein [Ornithinimicrobium sp.]HKJ11171.1 CDP-alcohol phosphatidyltransferase family protein [Ornithinimicrobium sp.]
MLDASVRALLETPLRRAAAVVDRAWLTPDRISMAGLVLGLASAVAAATQAWAPALGLWCASRACDGLDGALARRRRNRPGSTPAAVDSRASGGFLDITADFLVYGASVVGVAVGVTAPLDEGGYGASWLPFALVLFTYYVNGTAFLAFSSAAERTGRQLDDGRSFSFLGGLAEGTETIAVHSLWLLLPFWAEPVAWAWALVVGISAAQRMVGGYRTLSAPPRGS